MSRNGSVTRDPSGLWQFVVDLPAPEGRRRQVRRRGFPTKRAAQDALVVLLADARRGVVPGAARLTLGSFLVDQWLPAKAAALKPSTLASYEMLVRAYVVPRLGATPLDRLDGPTLNAFYATLLTSGRTGARRRARTPSPATGLAPKTVRNVAGMLHKAMADAVRWGVLGRNPLEAADSPSLRPPEMKIWSPAQLRTFLAASGWATPRSWSL